jgi:hypothetical protein
MAYQFQAYPKWKYNKTKPAVVVNDPGEEKKLGSGWQDTPFAPGEPEPIKTEEKK